MAAPAGKEPAGTGFEVAVAAIGGVGIAVASVVAGGAWLATRSTGGRVSGGLGDWLAVTSRLASSPGDPQAAWGDLASGLPGPVVYWACTLAVSLGVGGAITVGLFAVRRVWSPSRSRLGVPADARVARAKDVTPL